MGSWRGRGGRHRSLVVSGVLVLVLGGLGVGAGEHAERQAISAHRENRLLLQQTLSDLTAKTMHVYADEVLDELGGLPEEAPPAWSAAPGDPRTIERLRALTADTDLIDAGALLVDPTGAPLGGWSPTGVLPAADDPGWRPLREAVARGDGSLPLSDVLRQGGEPVLAMALPVRLSDGRVGAVIGLWRPADNALHQFTAQLHEGRPGVGFVVDSAGIVIAGLNKSDVGRPVPLSGVLAGIREAPSAVIDTTEDGAGWVTTYARAGTSGWTGLTAQRAADFEGDLRSSARLAQVAVVALLLVAGCVLVLVHGRREQALRRMSQHDELTGIYNRRGWFTRASAELEAAKRAGQSRALLFVDLDGLKQVNDLLGHREGDRAITAAAQVLVTAARGTDVVGRLGGDEFVLLVGEDGAEQARDRVRAALAEHNAGSGDGFELRLSVGAEVWFPEEGCSLDELVRRADALMYAEKTRRPGRSDGVVRAPRQPVAAR